MNDAKLQFRVRDIWNTRMLELQLRRIWNSGVDSPICDSHSSHRSSDPAGIAGPLSSVIE